MSSMLSRLYLPKGYFCLLVTLFLGIVSFPVPAQVQIDEQLSKKIDAYVKEEMSRRQIPGLALAIARNGKILKQQGYGVADVQNQSPVHTNTVFELASITKQFTAAAIMLLVQEGKIDLDDPIHTYLNDAPDQWKEIHVRHILTHTSGLPVLGRGFTGYATMDRETLLSLLSLNYTADIVYEAAQHDTLSFTPGDRFMYSDVGFFLAGLIVQRVSGIPYREFMQKRIFDPVGMDQTYILDQTTIHPNEARGYTLRDGKLVNIRRFWQFEIPSHYGIFSTTGDLVKWSAILNSEKLLSDESKEQLWSPMIRNNGLPSPYGFGWSVWRRGDGKIVDHTGITGTQITKFLNDTLTVVVLTNLGRRGGSQVNSWGIGPKIADIIGYSPYIDKDYVTLSGATTSKGRSSVFKKLAGEYVIEGTDIQRQLKVEEDKLYYDRGESRNEMALLDDGRLLMLGTTEEWILERAEKNLSTLHWLLNEQPNSTMIKRESTN